MVESLHTMTHSRPSMRPIPVMTPAAWIASSYMPLAASGESSRNGEPGSIRCMTRSRGNSLPRSRWRSRAGLGPPSAASARRASSASASARIIAACTALSEHRESSYSSHWGCERARALDHGRVEREESGPDALCNRDIDRIRRPQLEIEATQEGFGRLYVRWPDLDAPRDPRRPRVECSERDPCLPLRNFLRPYLTAKS